jgi:hypothetical protein
MASPGLTATSAVTLLALSSKPTSTGNAPLASVQATASCVVACGPAKQYDSPRPYVTFWWMGAGMADDQFHPGDRVYVTDPGLAELRAIMRRAIGYEPAPNHHGTIESVRDGMVVIVFDGEDGPATSNAAPYPIEEVRHLDSGGTDG